MFSIGKNQNYIRFKPNPGFSVKVFRRRWLHWCRACGWTMLKPGEHRRAVRPVRR